MKLAKEQRVTIHDRYVVLSLLNAATIPITFDEVNKRYRQGSERLDCTLTGVLRAMKMAKQITVRPPRNENERTTYGITDCGRQYLQRYHEADRIIRDLAAGK